MPEIPEPSAASPSTATSSPLAPFRFSLLTLLSVTTLAGLVSAVMFSRGWDPVERLLMAFWCAGLLLGVSIGRARGKPGIYSAGLGAALGCALATFVMNSGSFASFLRSESLLGPFLTFVICAGWFLAVGVAALYHALLTGMMESWWQQRLVRRTIYVVSGLAVFGIVAWQVVQSRAWKPAWELQAGFDNMSGGVPDIYLSPQGDQWLVGPNSPQLNRDSERKAQLHELTPRGLVSRPFPLEWHYLAVFSPDGKQIAIGRNELIRVSDVPSGTIAWSRVLELNSSEEVVHHQFSADGQQLLLTTHTPRIQRLYLFDATSGQPAKTELFPFAGHLVISKGGRWLLKFNDAEDENNELTVEVVDLATRETICRLSDVARLEMPVFSAAGDRLALGNRVWNLSTGQSRSLGAEVVGLLGNGRAVIVEHVAHNRWPGFMPAELQQMPFVKHLHSHETRSRLKVIDEANGQTLRATPWLENISVVELSVNQRTVASTSRAGLIRIWKVPE